MFFLCLSHQDHNLLVVGSRGHLAFLDVRAGIYLGSTPSLDAGWGVRSVSAHASIVTVGGGLGRLGFFDIRASAYLPLDDPVELVGHAGAAAAAAAAAGGGGSILTDPISHTLAGPVGIDGDGASLEAACYRTCGGRVWGEAATDGPAAHAVVTEFRHQGFPPRCGALGHAWDGGGSRLAVVGGPLFAEVTGAYLGIWR
jgi:hypothetical protein